MPPPIVMVTVTVSLSVKPPLSVTVKLKVNVPDAAGAVKLGEAVVLPLNETAVPPVCTQL